MAALATAIFGCSRTASTDSAKSAFPTNKSATTAWQLKCDRLCDVQAAAASLDALCTAAADAARPALGNATCTSRRAVGFPVIPASAVTDAAIVELSAPGKLDRTAFLAVKTATTWKLARPIGTGAAIKALAANPVDVPGLAPAGVQLQVAVGDEAGKSERMFVCGLTGEGNVHCPVAIEVASTKSSNVMQMAAAAGGSMNEWRVAVELTPTGYVAKKVAGAVPEGLQGEHGWDALPR